MTMSVHSLSVPVVVALLLIVAATVTPQQKQPVPSQYQQPRTQFTQARTLQCVNATYWRRCDAATGQSCDSGACRFGWTCVGASCRGPSLADHLLRAADYQIVLSVPASQLQQCSTHAADAAAGRMLCDVWHSTAEARPTFGHILGNTWLHAGFGPGADAPPCNASAAAWRACFGANIAAIVSALQAESPEVLFSGGLMEFLDSANIDNATDFPSAVCRPGSVGQWGDNTTCVPDVTRTAAQDYYIAWGQVFLDAGIRAFFFGQARLTGGSAPDGSDDVDPRGAAGFSIVISALRVYARLIGAGDVYFGPQAAAAITLANGTNIADWVYGAQHLEVHGGSTGNAAQPRFITQPTLRNGSYVAATQEQYGSGDFHDASRSNAGGRSSSSSNSSSGALPTVLDYDNYSGDAGVFDDIRRLAAVPDTAARAALLRNHYRYLRSYNPSAIVTVPFSKWLAVPAECACYANMSVPIWGAGSIYFSAFACGLVDVATTLWSDPNAGPLDGGVDTLHLGQQLQGVGDTVIHVLTTVLNRSDVSRAEYEAASAALPPRLYTARGARAAFITSQLTGAYFNNTVCPIAGLGPLGAANCTVSAAHRALLLSAPGEGDLDVLAPALASGALSVAGLMEVFAAEADAAGLYSDTA